MRVNTELYARPAPAGFEHERSDCGVRALMVALSIPYQHAHAELKAYGRKDRHWTYVSQFNAGASSWRMSEVDMYPTPTLAQFVKNHPKGRYVIWVTKHFVAVVDGVVHNWTESRNGPRTRVRAAWKFDAA